MAENDNDTRIYSSSDKPRTDSLDRKLNQMHSDRREEYTDTYRGSRYHYDDNNNRDNNRKIWIGVLAVIGVIVLGVAVWLLIDYFSGDDETPAQETFDLIDEPQDSVLVDVKDSPELINLQQQLAMSEFENLEREFNQLEVQQQQIVVKDDSKKQELQKKYDEARKQVNDLRDQLNKLKDSENKNLAEIEALTAQIKTLRDLLKHYLEEIDRLNKENEQLRSENSELRQSLDQTSSTLAETKQEKEQLAERMTLAEKLNVTGASFNMLNKKDKIEKKIKNAAKFVINFTIPQNNSTPPGTKTIYAVIKTPEGQILDGAGSFSFEGSHVTASARTNIDYGGEEIGGIKMYYDIRNALTPGNYSVQLFCDGYQLMSHPLEVSFNN